MQPPQGRPRTSPPNSRPFNLEYRTNSALAFRKTIKVRSHEWSSECYADAMAAALGRSAKAVRNAVESLVLSGHEMTLHYDHPLFFLQHMLWHEGYHHGQIKLALKISGDPFDDEEIGPLTWDLPLEKGQNQQTLKANQDTVTSR